MSASSQTVARFVTITMGLVIGLTFLFGFGNVLNLFSNSTALDQLGPSNFDI
jgi:hypothetical protein